MPTKSEILTGQFNSISDTDEWWWKVRMFLARKMFTRKITVNTMNCNRRKLSVALTTDDFNPFNNHNQFMDCQQFMFDAGYHYAVNGDDLILGLQGADEMVSIEVAHSGHMSSIMFTFLVAMSVHLGIFEDGH